MRCPACQFENLPGLTACARCGSPLELAAVAIAPPRASRLRVRTRLRRTWHTYGVPVLELRSMLRPLGYLQVAPIPWGAVLRSLVPGWGQMHVGRRRLGWWLLGTWAALLLLQLPVIGSGYAWLCLYLALSVHAAAVLLFFGDNLAYERRWMRMAFGLTVVLGLYTLCYRPTLWLTGRFATVVPLSSFTEGTVLNRGDVILVEGPWLRPAQLRRGDLVAYRIEADQHDHYVVRGGYNVDRIVGLPRDVVEIKDGALLVNGQPPSDGEQPLAGIPWRTNLRWKLLPGQYVVIPSRLLVRNPLPANLGVIEPLAMRLCEIPDRNITGRVACRLRPWSRFGPVE